MVAGSSVGAALPLVGLPVAEAVLGGGPAGLQPLQPLVLAALVNSIAGALPPFTLHAFPHSSPVSRHSAKRRATPAPARALWL